ncbi:hypothetical protein, partial [Edaphovirga cremea]|uniref:hypothetical protein n=1 Tax=Edaphovirga cremea TaxID=2267246 RepID=UPI0039897A24
AYPFLAGRLGLVGGVVVPGQWRRIIGSSRQPATPNFKKLFKRKFFRQKDKITPVFSLNFVEMVRSCTALWSKLYVLSFYQDRVNAI